MAEIESMIKETLMGHTYVIKKEGKKYALKVSSRKKMKKYNGVENPYNEIQVLKKIGNSKHIIKMINNTCSKKKLYLVTELCEGGELFDAVLESKFFSIPVAQKLFKQIVTGVKHIHDKGYCHLDLSTENILFFKSPRQILKEIIKDDYILDYICDGQIEYEMTIDNIQLKIIDFGQACVQKIFTTNYNYGKDYYRSPEICAGKVYSGQGNDIWAIGIILYMLLTGCAPFQYAGINDKAFLYMHNYGFKQLTKAQNVTNIFNDDLMHLFENIFTNTYANRYTIDDIIKHPFCN